MGHISSLVRIDANGVYAYDVAPSRASHSEFIRETNLALYAIGVNVIGLNDDDICQATKQVPRSHPPLRLLLPGGYYQLHNENDKLTSLFRLQAMFIPMEIGRGQRSMT